MLLFNLLIIIKMKKYRKLFAVLMIIGAAVITHFAYAIGGQGDYCDEFMPCAAGLTCENNVCVIEQVKYSAFSYPCFDKNGNPNGKIGCNRLIGGAFTYCPDWDCPSNKTSGCICSN